MILILSTSHFPWVSPLNVFFASSFWSCSLFFAQVLSDHKYRTGPQWSNTFWLLCTTTFYSLCLSSSYISYILLLHNFSLCSSNSCISFILLHYFSFHFNFQQTAKKKFARTSVLHCTSNTKYIRDALGKNSKVMKSFVNLCSLCRDILMSCHHDVA